MNTSVNRFFENIKGKTVAFMGAKVKALDRKDFEVLGENGVLAKEYGAELILGESYLDNIDADVVFRSPGTPFFKPELVAVRESGRVLTSEMEVFFELCPCKTIAVTGSDGKTYESGNHEITVIA